MAELQEAVVVSAVRSPMGRYGGQLRDVRPDDLAALVVREAVQRAQVEPAEVEDVIFGCANQAGEDNRNVARMALLLAGFPVEVPGQTVNRLCGSGMQACVTAAREIDQRPRHAWPRRCAPCLLTSGSRPKKPRGKSPSLATGPSWGRRRSVR